MELHAAQFAVLTRLIIATMLATAQDTKILSGCDHRCGTVAIPYPFGIGGDCYLEEKFNITCNTSDAGNPTAYMGYSNINITNIFVDSGELQIMQSIAKDCYDSSGSLDAIRSNDAELMFSRSGFTISSTKNKFFAIGCDTYGIIRGYNLARKRFMTGCMSLCDDEASVSGEYCSGAGCCEAAIPSGLKNRTVTLDSYYNHKEIWDFNPCSYAFIVQSGKFNFSGVSSFSYLDKVEKLPLIVDWSVGNQSCEQAKAAGNATAYCKGNSTCENSRTGIGYLCKCLPGYEGNPYHPDGCHDIDECKFPTSCGNALCDNTLGSYNCTCPDGHTFLSFINGPKFCQKDATDKKSGRATMFVYIVLSTVVGVLILLVASWRLHKFLKRREKIRRKHNNFKRNGGLLLQQQLNSGEFNSEKTKLFNSKELEKATNNFSSDRILGRGGQGTVFKGMLEDGRIVAVKKSFIRDEGRSFSTAKRREIINDDDQREIAQFINEIFILSQINHRNVVRLLGCCLETQVPLLVYEFLPNGTLSQYIHDEDSELVLRWDVRFQIARQVSGALSYLHSAASSPIYHRDIKSTNILLDEKYRAKIADFGTSRSVAIDQTHFTTKHVIGTYGYLDPEYFQSSLFTEKSDVYSFGVVLVELLTGKKAIFTAITMSAKRTESLVQYFINSMENTNGLFEILDTKMKELPEYQIVEVAKLAIRCLNLSGKNRPTMTEVAVELERIQSSEKSYVENQTVDGQIERPNIINEIEPWDFSLTHG